MYRNGDTSDIIRVVMYAYEVESDPQIRDLAYSLQGNTVPETCKNIFDYLLKNIRYVADTDTGQGEMVRTPARLVHDAQGDCKSYSLFTAVVLRWLGIPHVFRFVSYDRRKEATHVYVVADKNIIIDAVAGSQLGYPFGKEKEYTYRCDMANSGTKISYLSGFKRKAVGNTQPDDVRFSVFMNGESEREITPGKAWIYGNIDLITETINIAKNDIEISDNYNQLGIYYALLWAYDYVEGDTEDLDTISRIIAGMISEGFFTMTGTNSADRDQWFSRILSVIENRFKGLYNPGKYNSGFYASVVKNLIRQNQIHDDMPSVGHIGAFTPLADMLKKAGMYFIYLFIPDNELKNYPAAVAKKKKTQYVFYTLIHKVDIFHNAETVLNFFRSGIIARVGMQPEDYLKKLRTENVKNIGSLTATLVTISTILGLVLGLIELIKVLFPKSAAADYAVSSGVSDLENEVFSTKKKNGSTSGGSSSAVSKAGIGILGLSLIAGFFLMRKK